MKRILSFVLLAIYACIPLAVKAQGQDPTTHKWNGNPVNEVINPSNPEKKIVYLYNVGTGKFLNAGSYWGTALVGFSTGMTITIKKSTVAKRYQMIGPLKTTEGQYIAFGRRRDTPGFDDPGNYNRAYVDRGVEYNTKVTPNPYAKQEKYINGVLDWQFEETAPNSKTYRISVYNDEMDQGMGGKRYLQMTKVLKDKIYPISYPASIAHSDKTCQWKIVTRADLKAAFKDVYASDESPANATTLIDDHDFARGDRDVEKWEAAEGLTWEWANHNAYLLDPGSDAYTYYVGNGAITSNYYMADNASYGTANVRNMGNTLHANGKVSQKVQAFKKGWYRVSCNGFYAPDAGSSLTAELFVNVVGKTEAHSNVKTTLNRFARNFTYTLAEFKKVYTEADRAPEKVSPYVKAAKLFEHGMYNNTVLVYVPNDADVMEIGIRVSNSTKPLDWTCWDDFSLVYCGTLDLILDEGQTSTNYISEQVKPGRAATMVLKRTLEKNQWNSIVLPVSLTVSQLKGAFGEDVKLSEYPKQSGTYDRRIDFKKVDLDKEDDYVVFEAYKLYLIKPTKDPTVMSSTQPYKKLKEGKPWLAVSAPYYIINNITLDKKFESLPNYSGGILRNGSTSSSTTDGKLQFCGSLHNQTGKVVPAFSYALGKSSASNHKWLWHFTQTPMAVKGFRCWIATGSAAHSKALQFFVDNEEIENTFNGTTDIKGSYTEKGNNLFSVPCNIYAVDGKLVRPNATTTEGLPKGIYIVNHKKLIVK